MDNKYIQTGLSENKEYAGSNANTGYAGLSETKIVNINDFIFRQNLEFYPNLLGLSCENNVLKYQDNDDAISVTLTFDLRTLPGDVWQTTPSEFIKFIKLNKDCIDLHGLTTYIKMHAYESYMLPNNSNRYYSNEAIAMKTETAFIGRDNLNYLCDDAKSTRDEFEREILNNLDDIHNDSIKNSINNGIAKYQEEHPGKDSSILETTKPLTLSLVKTPDGSHSLGKYGYMNVAIIIYAAINIGIIVAIAMLK